MRKSIILLAALLLFAGPARGAETLDRIVAVVNDDVITSFQLKEALAPLLAEQQERGKPLPQEKEAELRRQVLEGLIEDLLIKQRAKELGLSVSDDEVEAAIRDIQRQNKLTREELKKALQAQGMDFSRYRETLRDQILSFKVVGREVQSKTEVTNQEIRDYFREHIDEYRERPTVCISRMTFKIPPKASRTQIEAIRKKAEAARARVEAGKNFQSVLLGFAADSTVEHADMCTFAEKELSGVFARAVKDLGDGEVSGVVETPDGFHLLKVESRSPGHIRQFDAAKDEISKILIEQKAKERLEEWQKELKKKAYIDVRL